MRLSSVFSGKAGIFLLACCLILVLWIDLAAAAEPREPQVDGEAAEEVEVLGRRSRVALRAEIIGLEDRMYKLYNRLNAERQFDVICSEAIVKGSRIPERVCSPVYMRRARATAGQRFLLFDIVPPNYNPSQGPPRNSTARSLNTIGLPLSDEQLWFQNNHKHAEFNANFRELAARSPELTAITLEWQDKQLRLAEAEARAKENSLLGRLFGKSRKDAN